MAKEVRAKPSDLALLADAFLTESKDLFTALKKARGDISLGAADFGNTDSAAKVESSYTGCAEAAGTNVERLIAVCEEDMESLYQVAFAYQLADKQHAEKVDGSVAPPLMNP